MTSEDSEVRARSWSGLVALPVDFGELDFDELPQQWANLLHDPLDACDSYVQQETNDFFRECFPWLSPSNENGLTESAQAQPLKQVMEMQQDQNISDPCLGVNYIGSPSVNADEHAPSMENQQENMQPTPFAMAPLQSLMLSNQHESEIQHQGGNWSNQNTDHQDWKVGSPETVQKLEEEALEQLRYQALRGAHAGHLGMSHKLNKHKNVPIESRRLSNTSGSHMSKPGCKKSGWDSALRKYGQMAELEAEIASKLSLAKQLEEENAGLSQKERLLKLQVANDERNLRYQAVGDIAPHLQALLSSFRSTVNRVNEWELLSHMPKDAKDFTAEEFRIVWLSFIAEITEIISEERQSGVQSQPGGQMSQVPTRAEEIVERMMNWIMLLCVSKFILFPEVHAMNMENGEILIQPIEFWISIVDKLALTEQQFSDMSVVYSLQGGMLQEVFTHMREHMLDLSNIINADLGPKSSTLGWVQMNELISIERKDLNFKKLQGLFRRYHILHIMTSFLVMGILAPWQRCSLMFLCMPSYPNFKLILRAACTIRDQIAA